MNLQREFENQIVYLNLCLPPYYHYFLFLINKMLKTVDHGMTRPAGLDDIQLKTTLPLYFTVLFYFFQDYSLEEF